MGGMWSAWKNLQYGVENQGRIYGISGGCSVTASQRNVN